MARKRHGADEIVSKLRQVDVLMAQGRPVADAVRAIGVTEVRYYRWRNEYGGLKGDQVDLTGSFCTKRIDRNWLGKELCHAEEEVQCGADRDAASPD